MDLEPHAPPPAEKPDSGSFSDTAVMSSTSLDKTQEVRRTKAQMNKLSSSTSQLSVSGHKKRLGFRRKRSSTFSFQRSEEVAPEECRHLVKQASSVSSDGEGSVSGDSSTWFPAIRREGEMSNFVEGLGTGQIVGRQALAAPNLGEIQLSISDRKGNLEVEVIRARGLQPGSKMTLPAPFVKVYLLHGRHCIAKAKTSTARKTLDPLYQEQLVFHEDYRNCTLNVTVWGDYGRMEKRAFLGMAQIRLDELNLSDIVISWYKLFHSSSMVNLPSTESFG
ncbi:unc-10 [Cordylochernes scorpioides]|nr:unc-10 [Cordylochernes scorpioides]